MSQLWSLMLWLLLGIALVRATPDVMGETPTPKDWPSRFHALLYQNFSGTIGIMDLYYDWDGGRNLHIIQDQYQPVLYDMEYQNGTVLKWGVRTKCRQFDAGVGLLPPNWLKGATYLGIQKEDGFSVNVWAKADFITYREDVVTKMPVGWTFYTGREVHVISFHSGYILAEEKWKVRADCFLDDVKVESSAPLVQRPCNPLHGIRESMEK